MTWGHQRSICIVGERGYIFLVYKRQGYGNEPMANQETMLKARSLIKDGDFVAARQLLVNDKSDTARDWLVKLDRRMLAQAKQLIQAKRFDDARAILTNMPGNKTAAGWLAKVNEISPPKRGRGGGGSGGSRAVIVRLLLLVVVLGGVAAAVLVLGSGNGDGDDNGDPVEQVVDSDSEMETDDMVGAPDPDDAGDDGQEQSQMEPTTTTTGDMGDDTGSDDDPGGTVVAQNAPQTSGGGTITTASGLSWTYPSIWSVYQFDPSATFVVLCSDSSTCASFANNDPFAQLIAVVPELSGESVATVEQFDTTCDVALDALSRDLEVLPGEIIEPATEVNAGTGKTAARAVVRQALDRGLPEVELLLLRLCYDGGTMNFSVYGDYAFAEAQIANIARSAKPGAVSASGASDIELTGTAIVNANETTVAQLNATAVAGSEPAEQEAVAAAPADPSISGEDIETVFREDFITDESIDLPLDASLTLFEDVQFSFSYPSAWTLQNFVDETVFCSAAADCEQIANNALPSGVVSPGEIVFSIADVYEGPSDLIQEGPDMETTLADIGFSRSSTTTPVSYLALANETIVVVMDGATRSNTEVTAVGMIVRVGTVSIRFHIYIGGSFEDYSRTIFEMVGSIST